MKGGYYSHHRSTFNIGKSILIERSYVESLFENQSILYEKEMPK
jgi:hypothetical protein